MTGAGDRDRIGRLLVYALLGAAVVAVYFPVLGFGPVSLDDGSYVFDNSNVRAGLNPHSLLWAFTTTHRSNWHPLTWISLQLDSQFLGVDPRTYHFMNVVLHLLNTLLLFSLLRRMTGRLARSAIVALLFAVHPLHVESVAWITERKDVLSTLFWMLTMLAYHWYVERPAPGRYALVLLTFGLGLMAKPMLVTLPVVLLLMDYWPLGRIRPGPRTTPRADSPFSPSITRVFGPFLTDKARLGQLLLEKAPLFVLAAVSSAMTVFAQRHGGAMAPLADHSLGARIANALVSYCRYLGKTLWPVRLSVFYPLPPQGWETWRVLGSAALLALLTLVAVLAARKRPYLIVGWLWYLVTLVPMIGLVQVGDQAMADRYTYIPLTGLFIMAVWGTADMLSARGRGEGPLAVGAIIGGDKSFDPRDGSFQGGQRWPGANTPAAARTAWIATIVSAATVVIFALMVCAHFQVQHWRNSGALYDHALAVTESNAFIHNNMGVVLAGEPNLDKAIPHFREAIRIDPGYSEVYTNLALALIQRRGYEEAMDVIHAALDRWPDDDRIHEQLGLVLALQGRSRDAIPHLQRAIELNPDNLDAHLNLGTILAQNGELGEARQHAVEALRIDPSNAHARRLLERLGPQ